MNQNGGSGGLYPFFCCEYFKNYLKNEKFENIKNFNFIFYKFSKKKFQKNLEKKNFEKNLKIKILIKNFFFEYFLNFFFTFSAAPRKFRTTDKKIIKIHQLEQILEKGPLLVHCAPPGIVIK